MAGQQLRRHNVYPDWDQLLQAKLLRGTVMCPQLSYHAKTETNTRSNPRANRHACIACVLIALISFGKWLDGGVHILNVLLPEAVFYIVQPFNPLPLSPIFPPKPAGLAESSAPPECPTTPRFHLSATVVRLINLSAHGTWSARFDS